MVLLVSRVKLTEGLAGIWSFFFPQYFTSAILLGACQVKDPALNSLVNFAAKNSLKTIPEFYLSKYTFLVKSW